MIVFPNKLVYIKRKARSNLSSKTHRNPSAVGLLHLPIISTLASSSGTFSFWRELSPYSIFKRNWWLVVGFDECQCQKKYAMLYLSLYGNEILEPFLYAFIGNLFVNVDIVYCWWGNRVEDLHVFFFTKLSGLPRWSPRSWCLFIYFMVPSFWPY